MNRNNTKSEVCSCGALLDSATNLLGKQQHPRPGQFSLCIHCGKLIVFKEDLSRREPNEEELQYIANTPEVKQKILDMQMAIAQLKAQRRRGPGKK